MTDGSPGHPRVVGRRSGACDALALFDRLPASPHRFLLESGANGPPDARRYSFLGTRPFCTLTAKGDRLTLTGVDHPRDAAGDPFALLDALLAGWRLQPDPALPPFSGGMVGYIAYDAGRWIERLPATAVDASPIPDLYLCAYDALLCIDHQADELWAIAAPLPGREQASLDLARELLAAADDCPAAAHSEPPPPPGAAVTSNFDREGYRQAVDRARSHILRGDIFEVNLSQRYRAPLTAEPRILYERLRHLSPAPFSGFLDFADVQIVSSSPERFLRVDPGRRVETRPIKGTRPTSEDPARDAQLRSELLASEKDQAELRMIVDLARNDLGRVCQIGTVRATAPRMLERYANVHQAVALVEGDLMPGATIGDLLRATSPGGSITGAPKVRAMEIIEELEGVRRNAYCGAMGYIGFTGELDLSILIRTMVCAAGEVSFGAGGAIVLDSDPDDEYEETRAKASAMLRALGAE